MPWGSFPMVSIRTSMMADQKVFLGPKTLSFIAIDFNSIASSNIIIHFKREISSAYHFRYFIYFIGNSKSQYINIRAEEENDEFGIK
jgi:hypothetical protein